MSFPKCPRCDHVAHPGTSCTALLHGLTPCACPSEGTFQSQTPYAKLKEAADREVPVTKPESSDTRRALRAVK
jgi:hypothetical protein